MSKSHSIYQFPSIKKLQSKMDLIQSKSDSQIIASVHKFSEKTSSRSTKHYMKERDTHCAFHMVLNKRGIICPNFRPFLKLRKHIDLTNDEMTLGRDTQVVNLHYLYSQHHGKFRPKEIEFQSLLSGDEFDFSKAEKYAIKVWTGKSKNKYSIILDDKIMMELSTFKSKAVRDRLGTIRELALIMENKVRNYSTTPRSRLSLDEIPKRIDEYECLKYADGSPSIAAKFYELKTGKVISSIEKNSREHMRRRKIWFEKTMNVRVW